MSITTITAVSTVRSDQAVLKLRSGYAYEGTVEIDAGWVHFDGRRRVGYGSDVSYRRADPFIVPRGKVASIRWIGGDR